MNPPYLPSRRASFQSARRLGLTLIATAFIAFAPSACQVSPPQSPARTAHTAASQAPLIS